MKKRFALAGLLLCLGLALAFGQDAGDRKIWTRLGLSDEEITRLTATFDRTERTVHQSRLEIEVLKAQLKKVLFQDPVDMNEVERLLRASLDWEYKLRLAQITRQVEVRQVLGDRKYARLFEALRKRRQDARPRDQSDSAD
jgi:septal ring factor EnvC (AmiA/AmiB activator)